MSAGPNPTTSEKNITNAPAHLDSDFIVESLLRTGEYHLDCDEYGGDVGIDVGIGIIGDDGGSSSAVASRFRAAARAARGYKRGEVETIRRVLEEIELIGLKRSREGLNEFNFSVGVYNCFFIAYMFGAHPEHFWLIYLVQGMYMIPRKFYNMWNARPLNQALYYLDFCWCMNFAAIFIFGLLVFVGIVASEEDRVSNVARGALFNAMLGVSCGTIMGANIALPFVACLFHDVNTMTGLFIHMMPPLVMHTFMWNSSDIRAAWPRVFHLTHMDSIQFFPKSGPFVVPSSGLDSVVGSAVVLYLMWWIPYVCFMLLLGIDLPNKTKYEGTPNNPKWDTVFHSTMRGGVCIAIGNKFRGRSRKESLKQMEENNFDRIDFSIYMVFHMIASVSAIYVIGYPCFKSQNFHLFMLVVVAGLAVTRGASRYTYYMTKMYSRSMRKQFASVFDEAKQS